MGAYMYVNKPSHIALARIEITADDGSTSVETVEVALFRYAYKPTHSWDGDKLNQRWRFQSGAAACAAAWARTNRKMPKLGAFYSADDGKLEISAPIEAGVFLTYGECEVLDDCATWPKGHKVLAWVRLPKGCVVRKPALENRVTRTTVLQVRKVANDYHPIQARLFDEATGEAMCGWWLLRGVADVERQALKYKVLAKPAPADAEPA